jgi:predicted metal-dependent phosphoesterase TrpH
MRPFRRLLQHAFGLGAVRDLDYGQLCYHPPYRPDDVWRMETANAARLGAARLLLAITDHDEVAGGLELRLQHPEHASQLALGEELSIWHDGALFHLGLSGLPADGLAELHGTLRSLAQQRRLDELFELLASVGCLVVLNHPLIGWGGSGPDAAPAAALLRRYGWAIDALEFNAMRSQAENRGVMALSQRTGKPLVGGGDSHLLLASAALCASQAATYAGFVAEVKSGWTRPIVLPGYFAPHRWKMFLRVMYFIARYRDIAEVRGEPVRARLEGRWVLLDPVGAAARAALALSGRLGWLA